LFQSQFLVAPCFLCMFLLLLFTAYQSVNGKTFSSLLTMLLYMCSLQDLTHLLCLYKSTVALDGPHLVLYGAVHLRVLSGSCFCLINSSFYLHCSIFY